MLKNLGVQPYLFPMPVLMIATYNEDGSVDVMNMAWGGICSDDLVALNLAEEHMTSENIQRTGAFTISVADLPHLKECDYLGIASARNTPDKFARTGLKAHRSELVDAPIVEDFPLTLECEVVQIQHGPEGFRVVGRIRNCLADERLFDEQGRIDASRLNAFCFDQTTGSYYAVGPRVAKAFNAGLPLLKKKA